MEPTFDTLGLIEPILAAVRAEGYERPTPIQARAIPIVLAGDDLLGLAQTGTGKTAAFALPILQRLHHNRRGAGRRVIRCLVLTPTRELAAQIADSFNVYGKNLGMRCAVIFGGVGHEPQRQLLRAGIDILVATPGRFLDLAGERLIDLSALEVFVLDEADRMLDMGFIHDVRRVIALLPRRRQTLFFSATMPPEAKRLADDLLAEGAPTVAVTPVSSTVDRIEQSVYFVEKAQKRTLLEDILYDNPDITRALVFTRTKHGANRVAEHLVGVGESAAAIHGNKSQSARERAMSQFREGSIRVLVATDIAARGIDIDEISHVINFDLPEVPETYVHRIGRTARAGADGIAISMCDVEEVDLLRDIERLIRKPVPLAEGHAAPGWASRRGAAPAGRPTEDRRDAPRSHARPSGHGPGRDRQPHGAGLRSAHKPAHDDAPQAPRAAPPRPQGAQAQPSSAPRHLAPAPGVALPDGSSPARRRRRRRGGRGRSGAGAE